MLQTYPLSITLVWPDGDPVVNGRVSIRLMDTDIAASHGVVGPESFELTTDANGQATIDLWPNTEGVNGTQYRVRAYSAEGARVLAGEFTMPAAPANLRDILLLPAPSKKAYDVASIEAITADRVSAEAAALAASGSETAAGASATLAGQHKDAAEAAALAASGSETAAGASATLAGQHKDTAEAAALAASGSETAAGASATLAGQHKDAAEAAALAASGSETAAGASATLTGQHKDAAEAAALAAGGSETAAGTSATLAGQHKDAAEAAALAASGSETAAGASATLAGEQAVIAQGYAEDAASGVHQTLIEIAATKGVTPVDIFIYDTSRDSDGGAWRHRCQHTSWYSEPLNTATRGSRKEFPAVAVIVLGMSEITIYDGDDPSLPMWMVFYGDPVADSLVNLNNPKRVKMLNGILAVATAVYGCTTVNFISDTGDRYWAGTRRKSLGNIAQRNDTVGFVDNPAASLVNTNGNDVALTILPKAPVDPATGLQIPTIAVATDGGVSVIKDDGSVVDITGSSNYDAAYKVCFDESHNLVFSLDRVGNDRYGIYIIDIPDTDIEISSAPFNKGLADEFYTYGPVGGVNGDIKLGFSEAVSDIKKISHDTVGGSSGMALLSRNKSNPSSSMVARITSQYCTGHMHGDIKGAWLADTTAETISGSELITNGTFDTDTSGWSDIPTAPSTYYAQAEVVSGQYVIQTQGGLNSDTVGYQTVETIVGRKYVASVDVNSDNNRHAGLRINNVDYTANDGTVNVEFIATTNPTKIDLRILPFATNTVFTLDNVSVRLVEEDRSVNNNPLNIIGSLTKSPVATGSELVAYSGFSTTNYLEQPYNPDLDFGTGDFYVMGWFNKTDTVDSNVIFDRQEPARSNTARVTLLVSGGELVQLYVGSSGFVSSGIAPLGQHVFVCCGVKSSQFFMSINGVTLTNPTISGSPSSVTNADALLRFGSALSGAFPFNGSLALWRIGAGAPTAEQIKKIYEDEKVLFQENAACTLYGSSDAVTALAHDPVTDLLHVGTSAGRSVFQGLRRVDYTTDPVTKAISAVNDFVVEG